MQSDRDREKPRIPVAEKSRILRPEYGPGSGNHNGRQSTCLVKPWADTLRACQTTDEVNSTLLWIIKHNPHASSATRKKWSKVAEHTRERIRVDAMKETSRIVIPELRLR